MTDPIKQALDALRDGLSACQSVSMSRDRRITRDGCVSYLQTEEWCRWLEGDVAPKIRAAIEVLKGLEKADPVAWLRRDELEDLQTCNYRRLGADSPKIWAPNTEVAPPPDWNLVPVFTHPAPLQAEPVESVCATCGALRSDPVLINPAPVQAEPAANNRHQLLHQYDLELPSGDGRKAKVVWSERETTQHLVSHKLCISISEPAAQVVGLPPLPEASHVEYMDDGLGGTTAVSMWDGDAMTGYALLAAHGIKPPEKGGAV